MKKKRGSSAKRAASKRAIETALIENFVKLQKVLTNLAIKFDGLSDNISSLLQLFEIAAKSFIQKQEEGAGEDRELFKKFDNLSDQISKLLQLFEIAAKSFIQKQEEGAGEDKDLLKKLDTLLDQNKTIAKGLTLIEEKIRHKTEGLAGMPGEAHHYGEAELHGFYPGSIRPRLRNGNIPRF